MKNYFNKFPNIIRQAAILLLLISLLLLIYAPAFKGHYVFGEDYGGLWTSKWPLLSKESFFSFEKDFPFEGRLLEVFYIYIIYIKYINPLKTLDAANTLRFVNIISVALLACILYLIFFKVNKFQTLHALLLSILICTLPPFQYYVGIICCGGSFIHSAIFSSLATLILFVTVFKENRKIVNTVVAVLIAIVLLQIALNFHQSTTMIYWSLALIPLIKLQEENFIKKWGFSFAVYLFTGFTSIILYYIIVKIRLFFIDFTINSIARRGAIIGINDIHQRIIDFINYPFYTALNLWNIFPDKKIALLTGIVITIGLLWNLTSSSRHIKDEKDNKGLVYITFFFRYLLITVIIPLSFLPNLLLKENIGGMIPKLRTLTGLEITIILLLYWGLMNISEFFRSLLNFSSELQKKIITFLLIILTVIAGFSANSNINKFVKLHSDELRYIKNSIEEYGVSRLSEGSEIYIIKSDGFARGYFSEFTYLTSSALSSSIEITRLALYEVGIRSEIHIKSLEGDDYFLPQNSNILFIDMRKFQEKAYKELMIPLSIQPLF